MVANKFTSQEKARIVLESLNTNISTAELCRNYNIHPNTFYQWKERFIAAGKTSLNGKSNSDICRNLQKENENLKRIIGELTIAHSKTDMLNRSTNHSRKNISGHMSLQTISKQRWFLQMHIPITTITGFIQHWVTSHQMNS